MGPARGIVTLLHRWAGLAMAGFLFVAGVTGAVISWDHELDHLLNPHLTKASSRGAAMPPLELARLLEARKPQLYVSYLVLHIEPGEAVAASVSPRINPATGKPFDLGFNQVFLDPVTGAELGTRDWGTVWPVSRENFVSFLYKLHYSLHIPGNWGIWLMGGIALVWLIDCFIGFYLTLPSRRAMRSRRTQDTYTRGPGKFWSRWKPAWKIKTSGSAYRINFDIHRAFGLWFWIVLFVVALTSASLNLYREITQPIVGLFSAFTPSAYDVRTQRPVNDPLLPSISLERILDTARVDARQRNWTEPAGSITYAPRFGIYRVRFFHASDDDGAIGAGPPALYYDGQDGRYLGERVPLTGTAGDIFLQLQFPLHSGRVAGTPGRILISFTGLVVAALSVSGVVIWYRKGRARRRARPNTSFNDSLPLEGSRPHERAG